MDKLKRIEELDILIKESAEDLIFYGRQLALSRIYERQVDKEWFYKHKKSHQMLLDERHELKQTMPKKIDCIKDEITCDVHLNENQTTINKTKTLIKNYVKSIFEFIRDL